MSRRNAEAGEPATASRARRRLTASLGPAGNIGSGVTGGAVSGPGLLGHGNGAAGGEPFRYDGGARPARDEVGSPSGGAAHGPSRFRWRTGVRVAVVVGILGLLLGGWFWWDVAAGSPQVTPLGDVRSTEGSAQPDDGTGAPVEGPGGPAGGGPATGGKPGGKIVVHVAGAVKRAGVVELPQGSRVHEAIAAAEGSTAEADLNRLNLAAVLIDGQKIYVPAHGEVVDEAAGVPPAGPSAGEGASGGPAAGARIDLNSATAEELGALPRVGPVLAQRIVDWRKEHGRFSTVEELDAVDGVGPKMLETLLPLVRVS
ncbi:ComEA family DNA-binding protein [Arthrobacter sp. Y81]|uniref:ComEA family DNA-binding protein n=1 Tax=Arthrobacter sp. Y81 TaxID=2058897 RepID=UPI000CE55BCC|nr:ComEA family DNA-binding protein [Arthrobacter sp. Y81]